jgi:hypothetical protein
MENSKTVAVVLVTLLRKQIADNPVNFANAQVAPTCKTMVSAAAA